MKLARVLCFICLTGVIAGFGWAEGLENPDFEAGAAGQTPPGWRVPEVLARAGFSAVLSADQPRQGNLCAEIRWPTNQVPAPDLFANLMQSVDATPWRNKRIKVTAAIRVAGAAPGARAQMWLRVDRPGGMGAFDNMNDRPVRSAAWADYSITADVVADAKTLNLGLMALNGATAWWDDVRLQVAGESTTLTEPPRPLDPKGLRNLVAFARLLGYVRHFHPSDQAATNDWLRFAVAALPKVEPADAPADLAARLEQVFAPIAPTVRVCAANPDPPLPPELTPPLGGDTLSVRVWEHIGFTARDQADPQTVYRSGLRTLTERSADALPPYARPTNVFRADLGAGVRCLVPTALFVADSRTLPHGPFPPASDTNETRFSVAHRGARLAAVMLAWNVLEHFYPYFDVVETDWPKELENALQGAASDADDAAFHRTLNRLIVALHDGHGNLLGPGQPQVMLLPLLVEPIAGQLVVTTVAPDVSGLKPGDIVEQIDGRPALEVYAEVGSRISSATAQWRKHQAAFRFGAGPVGSSATLQVRGSDGSLRAVEVIRSSKPADPALSRPPKLHELKPGVFYVDLTRLTQAEFDAALPTLAKARGLVFELRGYSAVSPQWLGHLSRQRLQSAQWNVPKRRRPGPAEVEWITSRWDLEIAQPQLTTNCVFLTDGSAISYAETLMGIVEAYRLGQIVGEPTAGTNGNVNTTELPLGYRMVWTGMKVLKHDGRRHHGVGIQPTVPVSRTLQGIREGRDEPLERALSLLK